MPSFCLLFRETCQFLKLTTYCMNMDILSWESLRNSCRSRFHGSADLLFLFDCMERNSLSASAGGLCLRNSCSYSFVPGYFKPTDCRAYLNPSNAIHPFADAHLLYPAADVRLFFDPCAFCHWQAPQYAPHCA